MKLTIAMLAFGLAAFAQEGAKQDMKDAGHNTKEAAKDFGKGTAKATKNTGKAIKKGTHKTAKKVSEKPSSFGPGPWPGS